MFEQTRGADLLRLLRLLSLRPIRNHPLRTALAVLAVAAGTAMAVSVLVVRSSVEHSVEAFGESLSGPSELRVVGAIRRGGIEADVADQVEAAEGVSGIVPMVQAVTVTVERDSDPATADESPVLALGVDCRAEALVSGSSVCAEGVIADDGDRPLARGPGVGDDQQIRTNQGDVSLADVPVFDEPSAPGDGQFVIFALPAAQRLFDRGTSLDVIYVEPVPGEDVGGLKDELQSIVGEHNGVLDATEGPPEVAAAMADFLPLFSLLALFALGTGSMLVYNTVTLAVERRRRELAITGALGGTRRAVVVTTLAEAGVVGFLGGLGGAIGGVLVAGPIVASLARYTERVAGIPLTVHSSPVQLLAGALLGLALALVAAVPGARRATRVEVAGELSGRGHRREASTPHLLRRLLISGSAAGTGLGLVWLGQRDDGLTRWQFLVGALGFAMTAIALLLFGAALVSMMIRPLRPLAERSAAGRLAIANLTGAPGRTGVMVAALAAAATTAFVTSGFSHGFNSAIAGSVERNMAGVQVSAVGSGANINVDAGIPDDAVAELAAVDGVSEVFRGSSVLAGSRPGETLTITAYQDPWDEDGRRTVRGRLDRERFEQGEALIGSSLARDRGLRPGDVLTLPTPEGMAELPVQAIVFASGTGDGWVEVPYDIHVELFGPQPVRSLYLEATPGTDYDELAERVRSEDLGVDVQVKTPREVAVDSSDSIDQQMAPFWTLQRGLLAVAFVAALSTMLLVGVQRRQELATLAAVGMAPWTLARMVLSEAGLVGAAATVLSLLGGIPMLWAMVRLAPVMMGYPVPFEPDWVAVPFAGVTVLAVVLLAAAWPALRAARTDILPALRSE